jgi:hypothetical protein
MSWFVPKKRKACMVFGSSYVAMNQLILSKYGIELWKPEPKGRDYCVEIEQIGISYHLIANYLSMNIFYEALKDCNREYPSSKYDLEIVIVISKEGFISERLKPFLLRIGSVVAVYLRKDLLLLRATPFEDLAPENYLEISENTGTLSVDEMKYEEEGGKMDLEELKEESIALIRMKGLPDLLQEEICKRFDVK